MYFFPALGPSRHRGRDHGSRHVVAHAARNTAFPVSTICHTVRLKQHSSCTEVEMATAPMMKHAHAVSITTRQWPRVETKDAQAQAHQIFLLLRNACTRALARGGEHQGRDCMALLAIL
jgi:hypothetical protein